MSILIKGVEMPESCDFCIFCAVDKSCEKCWLDWLKAPVEEAQDGT